MGRKLGYTREDDRAHEERAALPVLIGGVDTFLSGWGGAAGGASVALWACSPEDAERVWTWVKKRSDIRKVRRLDEREYPGGVAQIQQAFGVRIAHAHIYAVTAGHPALREG